MTTTPENTTGSKVDHPSISLYKSILIATVIGFAVVSLWRGVWYLWDVFTFTRPEDKLISALASLLTGAIILSLMRSFYSVLAPPIDRINIRSRWHKSQ